MGPDWRGLASPPACSSFWGGPLARPGKAQFLWATTCSGDQVTQPPGMVSAVCPPSPTAFQPTPQPLGPHLTGPPAHFCCHILERRSRGVRGM